MRAHAMPTLTLYTFAMSHYSEKIRWTLDVSHIAYREVCLSPAFHIAPALRMGGRGQTTLPIIQGDGESVQDSPRILRFVEVSRTLQLIQQRQFSRAVEAVKTMANEINASSFDFEAACNLGSLLAVLTSTSIDLSEGAVWIRSLGMRYANTRGLCELMANACNIFPPYSESIRECLLEINKTAEKAMARSLSRAVSLTRPRSLVAYSSTQADAAAPRPTRPRS